MLKRLIVFAIAAVPSLVSLAGVNEKWTVETTEIDPHGITAYHGETINMEVTMLEHGRIIRPSSGDSSFFWQTNGMANAWWSTNATYKCGVVKGAFGPMMDTGAADVTFFFLVTDGKGGNYRANGTITLLDSPFFDIRVLDFPKKILDFGIVSVTNANLSPFELKGSGTTTNSVRALIDGSFSGGTQNVNRVVTAFDGVGDRVAVIEASTNRWDAKQDAIADLETIRTNAALGATAVRPSAIADMATKTWVGGQHYVDKSVTNGLASQTWVTDKKYVTASVTNELATTNYVNDLVAKSTPGDYLNVSNKAYRATSTNDFISATNSIASNVSGLASVVSGLTSSTNYWNAKQEAIPDYTTTNAVERIVRAMKPVRLGAYLWEIGTEGERWDIATNRLSKVYPSWHPMCTGLKAGKLHGRNLDWYYDKCASFVVRCPARDGKYAAIGVAGGLKMLTDDFVQSEKWHDAYYSLPFTWTDGMNSQGVVIQSNVVPKDETKSSAWRTNRPGAIIAFAVIRYALERCGTAYDAAQMLKDVTFVPDEFNYDDHYLVSDATSSFIVEDGHVYSATDIPTDLITNFRLGTVIYGSDKKVDWNTVEQYGIGVERYDQVRDTVRDNTTVDGLLETMKDLWYTKSYAIPGTTTWPFWYTENCGPESETGYPGLTVMNAKNDPSVFLPIINHYRPIYEAEHEPSDPQYRGGVTWQTVHTAIYDQENLTLRLWTQENPDSGMFFKLVKDSIDDSSTIGTEEVTNIVKSFGYTTTNAVKNIISNSVPIRYVSVLPVPSADCTNAIYQVSDSGSPDAARFYRCDVSSVIVKKVSQSLLVGGAAYCSVLPTGSSAIPLYQDVNLTRRSYFMTVTNSVVSLHYSTPTQYTIRNSTGGTVRNVGLGSITDVSVPSFYHWFGLSQDLSGYQEKSERTNATWTDGGSTNLYPTTHAVSLYVTDALTNKQDKLLTGDGLTIKPQHMAYKLQNTTTSGFFDSDVVYIDTLNVAQGTTSGAPAYKDTALTIPVYYQDEYVKLPATVFYEDIFGAKTYYITEMGSRDDLIRVPSGDTLYSAKIYLATESSPVTNNVNPITSGGVYDALLTKQGNLTSGDGISLYTGDRVSAWMIQDAFLPSYVVYTKHVPAPPSMLDVDAFSDVGCSVKCGTVSWNGPGAYSYSAIDPKYSPFLCTRDPENDLNPNTISVDSAINEIVPTKGLVVPVAKHDVYIDVTNGGQVPITLSLASFKAGVGNRITVSVRNSLNTNLYDAVLFAFDRSQNVFTTDHDQTNGTLVARTITRFDVERISTNVFSVSRRELLRDISGYTVCDYVQDGLIAMYDVQNWQIGSSLSYFRNYAYRPLNLSGSIPRDAEVVAGYWGIRPIISTNGLISLSRGSQWILGWRDVWTNSISQFTVESYASTTNDLPLATDVDGSVGVPGTVNLKQGLGQVVLWGTTFKCGKIGVASTMTGRYDGTNMSAYQDGEQIGSSVTHAFVKPTYAGYTSPGYCVRCIRLYNRPLTEEEIRLNAEIDRARYGVR